MANKTYDAIVIGAGPGGYPCAIRLAQLGQSVLCVEKEDVGGICLNWGCVPSKALIASSHTLEKIKQGAATDFPWASSPGSVTATGLEGRDRQEAHRRDTCRYSGPVGVELMSGEARITAPRSVTIRMRDGKEETVDARKAIVVATGSSTIELPSFKFDGKKILGAKEAVSLRQIPKKLLVIGGGSLGSSSGASTSVWEAN